MIAKNDNIGKRNAMIILSVIIVVLIMLLGFQYLFLNRINREHAFKTAEVLIDQIENILEANEHEEQTLIETLKENYITKAKAVSYIIDNVPETENDIEELKKIADLMSIDEIHLFDINGTIYFGTVPAYYGYSFDSGEQMGFFKPMLDDKSLSMCQDVTPNTAESKAMMYALTWSDSGERMVQIGIEPVRLLEEMRTNEMEEVIRELPTYSGLNVIVADSMSEEILGSTYSGLVDMKLSQMFPAIKGLEQDEFLKFSTVIENEKVYCVAKKTEKYTILVTQSVAQVNSEISLTMLLVFLYLLFAAAGLIFIVKRLTVRIINEKRNADTDGLTGLMNRRAYENDLLLYETDTRNNDLAFIMLDINGLKKINDIYGHDEGDRAIKAFAEAIQSILGGYGTIYRVGGDEFVAIVYSDDEQIRHSIGEINNRLKEWSLNHSMELSMSSGYVTAREYPDADVIALIKIADERMYDVKSAYYQRSGHDRRKDRS